MIVSGRRIQKIVNELAQNTEKKINIMDETGRIVASTDPERIGSYHAGARRIIREKLEELLILPDECYEGTKEGINLPIVLDNKIIGVVGISGKKEEVECFGKIIKKMTEILIMNSYREEQHKVTIRNNCLYSWIFGEQENEDDFNAAEGIGEFLGDGIENMRSVAVLDIRYRNGNSPDNRNELQKQKLWGRIIRLIENWFKYQSYVTKNIVISLGSKVIIFLDSNNYSRTKETLQKIALRVEEEFKVLVYGGIGSDKKGVKASFKEANIACNVAAKHKSSNIKDYNNMDIELLIENIPDYEKQSFISKIFKECSPAQITEWVSLLHCYIENNGSINKTANQLYVHKNTLQYRLGKLKEVTGYDPRIMSELIFLYTAVLIWEQSKSPFI